MPDANARSVEFVGVPSSEEDGDLFFTVDRKTFERVTNRAPEPDEVAGRDKYRLYPRAMAAALRAKRKVKVKLSVQPI